MQASYTVRKSMRIVYRASLTLVQRCLEPSRRYPTSIIQVTANARPVSTIIRLVGNKMKKTKNKKTKAKITC